MSLMKEPGQGWREEVQEGLQFGELEPGKKRDLGEEGWNLLMSLSLF